ncbi:MAG: type II toxin-antitoxin system PemK/MazF family toxin [Candidatus Absconditabacterales bacterium]
MQKTPALFDKRNERKKSLEFVARAQTADAGEFWWYREGVNVGNEISKDGKFKRVGLVIKNNLGNGLIRILPLTTKYHQWMDKYYIEIRGYQKFDGLKQCWGVFNQIKFIDKKRLFCKVSEKRAKQTFLKYIINRCVEFLL